MEEDQGYLNLAQLASVLADRCMGQFGASNKIVHSNLGRAGTGNVARHVEWKHEMSSPTQHCDGLPLH